MLYRTQLHYIHPGQEAAFDAFEAPVLPLPAEYGGTVLRRFHPTPEGAVVAAGAEGPVRGAHRDVLRRAGL